MTMRRLRRLWLKFRIEFWWKLEHVGQALWERYCGDESDAGCFVHRTPFLSSAYPRRKQAERDYCRRLGVRSIYEP